METILFLATTEDGTLSKVSLETLSAAGELAQKTGSTLKVGIVGASAQQAADSISNCGAASFLGVTGSDFNVSRYSTDTLAFEAIVKSSGATVVLAPATSRFARSLPGVAARVNGAVDTKITSLSADGSAIKAQRWYYRQRMLATFSRAARPWLLLVESGISTAFSGTNGSAKLEVIPVEAPQAAKRTEVVGKQSPANAAKTIRPEASLLLVAGAGWTKKQADGKTHVKEGEQLILSFLDKTKASLGSSKSLVDQKSEGDEIITCLSHLNQVGQTGSSPRHQKGLATCCHGEEPHVVGWRFINERRAVNLNASCGWAQGKADVLYVADAFAVMAKVNELLG